jgi:hypothetical protein
LWVLARAELIADPPNAEQYGRHQMMLTARGRAALKREEAHGIRTAQELDKD